MSSPAIQVEALGKRYRLHHEAPHGSLRDRITSVFKKNPASARPGDEDFWALRDLNFSIQPGEVVGIVGRNGAGKSTLLKLLSRITEPTTGRITLHGRVASLLEVGTGFHGELSGRENIFLNGAILGMSRAEIRRKFDEIVAFAEVERFIDTPVKRYSSGMYMRLAFAVAAHLEPEILIVDEVLAVGDAAFQKKCLGKMQAIASGHGRTILFVSHNLAAIRQLCTRAIVLNQGSLLFDGTVGEAATYYTQSLRTLARDQAYRHIQGDGRVRITRIEAVSARDQQPVVSIFEDMKVTLHFTCRENVGRVEGFVLLYADDGECLAASFQRDCGTALTEPGEHGQLTVRFANPLSPGRYFVSAGLFDSSRQFLDWVEFAESFEVNEGFADGRAFDQRLGRISLQARWETPAP